MGVMEADHGPMGGGVEAEYGADGKAGKRQALAFFDFGVVAQRERGERLVRELQKNEVVLRIF